jgi:hypothetical protein
LRNAFTPLTGIAANLFVKECVETVNGNHARDFQFPAQKHCGMSAGQSSMSMDHIDPLGLM